MGIKEKEQEKESESFLFHSSVEMGMHHKSKETRIAIKRCTLGVVLCVFALGLSAFRGARARMAAMVDPEGGKEKRRDLSHPSFFS